jgi:hypothetical protein
VWVRRGKTEFVKLCHDDPEPELLVKNEQGFLADLFRRLWEDGESQKNLQKLADITGFRFSKELAEWCTKNGSAADFTKRWQRFMNSLG